jgi:serine protease inhibitor
MEMRMQGNHCGVCGAIGLAAALALLGGCGGDPGPVPGSSQSFAGASAAPFFLTGGSKVSAPMMRQAGTFDYLQGVQNGSAFQAIRIPYGQGRMSMLVVLPATGTDMASFASGIDASTLERWNAQLRPTTVELGLPRFTTDYQASMGSALASGATAITVTSIAQPSPPAVIVDRPFFYAVQDGKTGELLFLGVILTPAQT